MEYTLEALGSVIRSGRESLKLTQEELGQAAGYGAGAGVSISRIERGLSRPSPERLARIAEELDLTAEQLEKRARQRTDDLRKAGKFSMGEESLKQRVLRVQKELDERTSAIDRAGTAFNQAHDRARDNFFMKFVEAALGIEGAPQPASSEVVAEDEGDPSEEAKAHRLRLDNRLAAALASGAAAGAAVGGSDAYGKLTAALTFGTASTRAAISSLAGTAASSAAFAWLGAGSLAAGGAGLAGGAALLTGLVAAPALLLAAGGALFVARRTAKQRRELMEQLDKTEAGLAATRQGYLALLEFLPWAARILDYIAVHGGHALDRWQQELPQKPIRWDDLKPAQQQAYQDFITIAASQLSVITINVQALMTLRDKKLDDLKDFDCATLSQAEDAVMNLV